MFPLRNVSWGIVRLGSLGKSSASLQEAQRTRESAEQQKRAREEKEREARQKKEEAEREKQAKAATFEAKRPNDRSCRSKRGNHNRFNCAHLPPGYNAPFECAGKDKLKKSYQEAHAANWFLLSECLHVRSG